MLLGAANDLGCFVRASRQHAGERAGQDLFAQLDENKGEGKRLGAEFLGEIPVDAGLQKVGHITEAELVGQHNDANVAIVGMKPVQVIEIPLVAAVEIGN